MPFQFSLRALLRLRLTYEKRERMRLALLNATMAQLRNEYEETGEQRKTSFEELQERLRSGISGVELHLGNASLQNSANRLRELIAEMKTMELQVRKQTDAFLESQKTRKILDSLREREWQVYEQIESRREQQRIDDLFNERRSILPRG
ncbi:MAG: flagellar FliJ family protein [Terriglobia bacterium]